jgi:hypothetical protein
VKKALRSDCSSDIELRRNTGFYGVFYRCGLFIFSALAFILMPARPGMAEDASPKTMNSAFLVSPLAGPVRSEVEMQGPPGTPSRTLKDDSTEYGLFLMYANPRVVVNNTIFNTDVNDSKVWGNIATLNLYGDPAAKMTWYLGGGYLWHSIEGDIVDITISEPLAKAGVIVRVPSWHLSINPYVGYGWQNVATTIDTPRMTVEQTERTESVLYGVSAYWRWRMLYANAKYYLEDNRARDEQNNVFRLWATAMFTKSAGIMARFEYSEQRSSTDTSALFGPVFVF